MKLSLISSYSALIDALKKASDNREALDAEGWKADKYDSLMMKLGAIESAEHSLYASTHTLSVRVEDTLKELSDLNKLLVKIGKGAGLPLNESSFLYSTSMKSSSSLDWRYPSGSIWVTANPSCKVPDVKLLSSGNKPSKQALQKAGRVGKKMKKK